MLAAILVDIITEEELPSAVMTFLSYFPHCHLMGDIVTHFLPLTFSTRA